MFEKISSLDIVITTLLLILVVLFGVVVYLINELRYYKKTTIIQLGFKENSLKTDVKETKLSVNAEDFRINKEKLLEKLVDGFKTRTHPQTGTYAYCIMDHAGLYELLDSESTKNLKQALTRLLNNGDDEATLGFLKTIADSVE